MQKNKTGIRTPDARRPVSFEELYALINSAIFASTVSMAAVGSKRAVTVPFLSIRNFFEAYFLKGSVIDDY